MEIRIALVQPQFVVNVNNNCTSATHTNSSSPFSTLLHHICLTVYTVRCECFSHHNLNNAAKKPKVLL